MSRACEGEGFPAETHRLVIDPAPPGLRRDHGDNADDLRLRRQPVGIEPVGRPRQIFGHAVEAEAEKMLDLGGSAPAAVELASVASHILPIREASEAIVPKSLRRVVGATGIEPVTPTMST